ncbi:DUF1376 domain-containing protein [Hyphomicrobium sp. DY-1]|uniref:DUF1376 domain-containing protein n=1 Tax=Hyphomicrobium sp. DY-1 TaxID=3075650 RepID=UPI0039C07754
MIPGENGGPPIVDGDVPRMHIVRVHLNDWAAATRGFSLEEEGFYWRFTVLLYDRMGDLLDDDAHNARAMSLDIRVYKKMKARMVALGKIYIADGRVSNSRVEREITNYVREFKRRSEAAKAREGKKREAEIPPDFQQTSGELPPTSPEEVQDKSGELPPQLGCDVSEKGYEINEGDATTVPEQTRASRARARPKPKPKPKVSEESNPHSPQGGVHPLEQAFDDFWSAFPGSPPPRGRKTDRPKAFEIFKRIVTGTHRKGIRGRAEEIVRGAERYAKSNPDPEYLPMPTTWLNGARWQDHPEPIAGAFSDPAEPGPNGKRWGWWRDNADALRNLPLERWQAAIEKANPNGTWPWWLLTAPPGHAECLVPMELQAPLIEIYHGQINHDENGFSGTNS